MDLKQYFHLSDKGPLLNVNQDRCFFDLEQLIFGVLDGCGGSGIGDVAALEIEKKVIEHYSSFSADPDATMSFFYNSRYKLELNALVNSLHFSHNYLFKKNEDLPLGHRASCSGVLAVQSENSLNFLSVGAGNSFLIREKELFSIYESNLCIGISSLNSNEFIPENSIGMYAKLDYLLKEVIISAGDTFILSSDGLIFKNNSEDLIEKILNISSNSEINQFFEYSNLKGNKDNQSAIILRY